MWLEAFIGVRKREQPIRNATVSFVNDPKIRSDLLRLLTVRPIFRYIYLELGHVVTLYLVNLPDFRSDRWERERRRNLVRWDQTVSSRDLVPISITITSFLTSHKCVGILRVIRWFKLRDVSKPIKLVIDVFRRPHFCRIYVNPWCSLLPIKFINYETLHNKFPSFVTNQMCEI